jgi:hypothetical protein
MGVPIGTARNSLKKFAKSGCQFREEEERAQSLAVVSNYSCARSNVLMAKRALSALLEFMQNCLACFGASQLTRLQSSFTRAAKSFGSLARKSR